MVNPEYQGGAQSPAQNQTYMTRRTMILGGLAGAAGVATSGCARALRGVGNVVSGIGSGIGVIINKAVNYGSVDEHIKNLDGLDDFIEMTVLYPADYVLDMARGAKAIVYDIPKEALARCAEEAGVDYQPKASAGDKNGFVKVLVAPFEFAGNYLGVAAEGIHDQVTHRPIESILHSLSSFGVGKAAYDNNHGGGSNNSGDAITPPAPPFGGPGAGGGPL